MSAITFIVYGIPQTKGSAKAFFRKGMKFPVITNDNPKNKPWAQTVSAIAQQYRPDDAPWEGPIELSLRFRMPIPKTLAKKKQAFMIKRPDIDKCTRSVLDALKGVIYRDDSQVVNLEVAKVYDAEPGVIVTVHRAEARRG